MIIQSLTAHATLRNLVVTALYHCPKNIVVNLVIFFLCVLAPLYLFSIAFPITGITLTLLSLGLFIVYCVFYGKNLSRKFFLENEILRLIPFTVFHKYYPITQTFTYLPKVHGHKVVLFDVRRILTASNTENFDFILAHIKNCTLLYTNIDKCLALHFNEEVLSFLEKLSKQNIIKPYLKAHNTKTLAYESLINECLDYYQHGRFDLIDILHEHAPPYTKEDADEAYSAVVMTIKFKELQRLPEPPTLLLFAVLFTPKENKISFANNPDMYTEKVNNLQDIEYLEYLTGKPPLDLIYLYNFTDKARLLLLRKIAEL